MGEEIYGQDFRVVPGGGALNGSIALQRLGVQAGWIGAVGTDFFSRLILEEIEREGLDTSLCNRHNSPLRRVTVALSYPDNRAFVTYIDEPPDVIAQLMTLMEDDITFRHLHFPGLVIDERLPELIDTCHARGIQVSMDCQHREETLAYPLVRDTLSRLDLFMPNAIEAKRVTMTDNLPAALNILGDITPLVVIKNGAEGALARHNGSDYFEPALSLTALDTTGAGDVFCAGFLAAYLQHESISTCLKWGNFCGGKSTLGYGGFAAPTRAELENWLAEK